MNKQTDIGKMVEKALESLDGLERAEPRPFLFTRVKARLERDQRNAWETIGSFLTRPVVAIAGLCLILAMNIFILTQKESATSRLMHWIIHRTMKAYLPLPPVTITKT
jgi:hypothetical protein